MTGSSALNARLLAEIVPPARFPGACHSPDGFPIRKATSDGSEYHRNHHQGKAEHHTETAQVIRNERPCNIRCSTAKGGGNRDTRIQNGIQIATAEYLAHQHRNQHEHGGQEETIHETAITMNTVDGNIHTQAMPAAPPEHSRTSAFLTEKSENAPKMNLPVALPA